MSGTGITEVMDRPVQPMGHINPEQPPLTEKQNLSATPPTITTPQTTTTAALTGDNKSAVSFDKDEKDAAVIGEIEADPSENKKKVDYDPFQPFDDLPDETDNIVTIRAVVLGSICGSLVNASNVYLGLKTGWTFGASLFGAIVGFSVLKSLSRILPKNFPILGGDFGPRENNIVQTAATAAGGLSSVFISGIPALYQLGLLGTPQDDFPRLVTLTIVGGYFGFAFATPLRKFFIIYVARELRLIFPTPSATSMTIRSMHLAITGEAIAKMKMRALGIAFSLALILRVVSQYAIGILWDWHIFTWFYIWGGYNNRAIDAENWLWMIEFTPAFIGAGMLVGLNTALSFFGGSVLAWAIIGPSLVAQGMAFGAPILEGDEQWGQWMNYASLSLKFSTKDHPSPRYWLLWPGVLLMIAVSFTELLLQYKIMLFIGKAVVRACCKAYVDLQVKMGKQPSVAMQKRADQRPEDVVKDPAEPHELIPWYWWAPLLLVVIIMTCVVMGVQYEMPVGMSLLSVFLAFFFSFLAIQCPLVRLSNTALAGVTDITPLTAASKASQIVLGGATKGEGWATDKAQRLNLLGGSIASIGANQASDLVGDFRVGFLLRTSPRKQWIAQGLGTIVAVFLAPAMFILFAKAYPCIIDSEIPTCPFSAPSVAAWKATAVAVTDPTFPIPRSSGIFAIVLALFGVFMIIVRHYAYRGTWEKYRVYHPNMMCIGLAFVLPQTVYGTAMVMGAVPAYFWAKKKPEHFDIYGYAVAAGLIAGEGIGGVINAIFQLAGIAGPTPYGTQIGCPAQMC